MASMKPRLVAGRQRGQGEVTWAHNRPAAHRTPAPKVGDRVKYRANSWRDDEIVDAQILDVQWDHPDDMQLMTKAGPHPDPWPWVILGYEQGKTPMTVRTREARLEGSAGWLPLDWQRWPRPAHGDDDMGAQIPDFMRAE